MHTYDALANLSPEAQYTAVSCAQAYQSSHPEEFIRLMDAHSCQDDYPLLQQVIHDLVGLVGTQLDYLVKACTFVPQQHVALVVEGNLFIV